MRYSDIQLLNEKHWKKRSSSSSSSNFKDKKHSRHNRHAPEHDGSVPHHDSHKRRIKQRNQHNNHEHNKGRLFNKKRRNRISINLNTPRGRYSRPSSRTSTTSSTTKVPMEWDGNQWVDANSLDFVQAGNQASTGLDWDGNNWSDNTTSDDNYQSKSYDWNNVDDGVTTDDLDAAASTQKMMHQNYELNKRQKK